MGSADVIPGVSGGTIALILGIYTRLVDAIRAIDLRLARRAWDALRNGRDGRFALADHLRRIDLLFLVFLGIGILTAIAIGARIILGVAEAEPVATRALFFGLILASAWIPWRMLERRGAREVALGALGLILAYWMTGLPLFDGPGGLWFVPVAGAIAICAMILPGISGAFLLLVMGMYTRLLDAVREFDLVILSLFAAGAAVGLLAFSRVLSWLLHAHRSPTLAFLTGLMLGALRKVWPFQTGATGIDATGTNVWPEAWHHDVTVAVAAFLLGAAVVLLLDRLARLRSQPDL
jgi:putative membrane protein